MEEKYHPHYFWQALSKTRISQLLVEKNLSIPLIKILSYEPILNIQSSSVSLKELYRHSSSLKGTES